MRQELLIILIQKRDLYRADHPSGATKEQFLSFILDKAILNLIEARDRLKRGGGQTIVSLDEEHEFENGYSVPLCEETKETNLYGELARPYRDTELNLDTERLFRRFNKEQYEIGQLILKGLSPAEISRLIRMPRATLDRRFKQMEQLLGESGIQDFLPEKNPDPSGKSKPQTL